MINRDNIRVGSGGGVGEDDGRGSAACGDSGGAAGFSIIEGTDSDYDAHCILVIRSSSSGGSF